MREQTDEQKVRAKCPDARVLPVPGHGWFVFCTRQVRVEDFVGSGTAEAEAWADAARRVEER